MLDGVTFTREFSMLADRFDRDVQDEVARRYFEHVSQHLTTDEFERAARHIFIHDQFWPTPARFVEVVHGTPASNAEHEWARLMETARSGGKEKPPLSPAGTFALAVVGGLREVMFADQEYALPRMQRAFVRAYQERLQDESVAALGAPQTLELEAHDA